MVFFSNFFILLLKAWEMDWWVVRWRWGVIWWTARWWGFLLFSFFVHFFQFVWHDFHLLDWTVVYIIPPFVFPVHGLVLVFGSEPKPVVSSPNLYTFSDTLLFFSKTVTFFPAHWGHEFSGVFAFEFRIGDTWWLKKSLSVLGWHLSINN